MTTCRDDSRGRRQQWGDGDGNGGCNGDESNNQLRAEMAAAVMATATATADGSSEDDDGAAPDTKGGGVEVIGVDGEDEDCGADGRVLVGGSRAAATAMETTIN